MNFDPNAWRGLSGIDSDGPTLLRDLQELGAGRIEAHDQQIEILADLYRDGTASTAAYAAVPLLLDPEAHVSCRLRWEMCLTAGLVLAARGRDNLPAQESAKAMLQGVTNELAVERLLAAAAQAQLRVPELLDTFAVIMMLTGRPDLHEKLKRLVLQEYGAI